MLIISFEVLFRPLAIPVRVIVLPMSLNSFVTYVCEPYTSKTV